MTVHRFINGLMLNTKREIMLHSWMGGRGPTNTFKHALVVERELVNWLLIGVVQQAWSLNQPLFD